MTHTIRYMIKFQLSLVILVAGVAGPPTPLQAYQVWMSTCGASAQTITNPVCWSNVAAQVQGWHFNFLPPACPTNTPGYGDKGVVTTTAGWPGFFSLVNSTHNGYVPWSRSVFGTNQESAAATFADFTNHMPGVIEGAFSREAGYGAQITACMVYDDRVVADGPIYYWQTNEVQEIRAYLDSTGRTNVGVWFDSREATPPSASGLSRNYMFDSLPAISGIVYESSGGDYLARNSNNVPDIMVQWWWTNSAVNNKPFVFQLLDSPDEYGLTNNYMNTRRCIQQLAATMGTNFMQSSNVIFNVVTYRTLQYCPETAAPDQYTNTVTSIALSLIEQRNLFEDFLPHQPSQADADSTYRNTALTSGTWANPNTTGTFRWIDASNWASGFIAGSASPSTTDTGTATFNTKVTTGSQTIMVDSGRNIKNITVGTASGSSANVRYNFTTGSFVLTAGGAILENGAVQHYDAFQLPITLLGGYTFDTSTATSPYLGLNFSSAATITGTATTGNNHALTLQGSSTAYIGVNTSFNVIAGVIADGSGGGSLSVVKNGSGFWALNAPNTYRGGTTINAGGLYLGSSGTLGNTSGALTMSGGTLDLGALTTPTVGAVSITAAPASGPTITNGTLTASSYSATLTSGTATISAILAGSSAALTMNGSGGTLALNAANTYRGSTTITAGTLKLGAGGALNNSTNIAIGAGGILDVSGLASPYNLSTSLTAGGAALPATLVGAASGTVNLGSQAISLTMDGVMTHPALTVTNATALTVNDNSISVRNAAVNALAPGTYHLIQLNDGSTGVSGTLPVLNGGAVTGTGVAWGSTPSIAINHGYVDLMVVSSVASNPTNISYSITADQLTLRWPADHLGWYAQSNAVNLADTNYWFDITGSELATNLVITIRPSQTNVFYRLRYPN